MLFRWLALIVFLASLGVGALHARRTTEPFPRARTLAVAPLFIAIVLYLAAPRAMAWASLSIPVWLRWVGVALGSLVVPAMYWVLATFSANRNEAALSSQPPRLVTRGPYRRVRHPMYGIGLLLPLSIGLMAANWFILSWTLVLLILVRLVVIPREEARLLERFGDDYRRYRDESGSLLPSVSKQERTAG